MLTAAAISWEQCNWQLASILVNASCRSQLHESTLLTWHSTLGAFRNILLNVETEVPSLSNNFNIHASTEQLFGLVNVPSPAGVSGPSSLWAPATTAPPPHPFMDCTWARSLPEPWPAKGMTILSVSVDKGLFCLAASLRDPRPVFQPFWEMEHH
jgi:hypothetical protein